MSGRRLLAALAVLGLLFGLLCLNYTNGRDVDHHAEWAQANGMPEPGVTIFYLGAALTAVSAATLGWLRGSRRRS